MTGYPSINTPTVYVETSSRLFPLKHRLKALKGFDDNARHIPTIEDLDQSLPHTHRQFGVPPALVHLLRDPPHLLRDSDHQAVCRKPNRLHPHSGKSSQVLPSSLKFFKALELENKT